MISVDKLNQFIKNSNEQAVRSIIALYEAAKKDNLAPDNIFSMADQNDQTPLILAIEKGHHSILQLLIAAGADVNQKQTKLGESITPLGMAAKMGDLNALEILLRSEKIEVNAISKWQGIKGTAFWFALKNGHNLIVGRLLGEANLDPNCAAPHSYTPLQEACSANNLGMTRKLIKIVAVINHQYSSGPTPLYFAAKNRNVELCQLLLDAGIKADKAEETLYQIINRRPSGSPVDDLLATVQLLLAAKEVVINPHDNEGKRLFSLVTHNQHAALLKLLISYGYYEESAPPWWLQQRSQETKDLVAIAKKLAEVRQLAESNDKEACIRSLYDLLKQPIDNEILINYTQNIIVGKIASPADPFLFITSLYEAIYRHTSKVQNYLGSKNTSARKERQALYQYLSYAIGHMSYPPIGQNNIPSRDDVLLALSYLLEAKGYADADKQAAYLYKYLMGLGIAPELELTIAKLKETQPEKFNKVEEELQQFRARLDLQEDMPYMKNWHPPLKKSTASSSEVSYIKKMAFPYHPAFLQYKQDLHCPESHNPLQDSNKTMIDTTVPNLKPGSIKRQVALTPAEAKQITAKQGLMSDLVVPPIHTFFKADFLCQQLCLAISNDKIKEVERLLAAGVNPHFSAGLMRRTPLHLAVMKGNPKIIKLLLDRGTNPLAPDKEDNIPLHLLDKLPPRKALTILQSELFDLSSNKLLKAKNKASQTVEEIIKKIVQANKTDKIKDASKCSLM